MEYDYEDYADPTTEKELKSPLNNLIEDAAMFAETYVETLEAKRKHETATKYILFVWALCAVCISLFIVVLICRFKKLRTRTNMYILNISILNIVHTIGMAMLFLLNNLTNHRVSEISLYIQTTVTLLYITFTWLLALDWFISGWQPNWIPKSQKFDYFLIAGVYLIFFLEWLIGIYIYYTHHIAYRLIIFLVIYNVILLLMLVFNILRGLVEFKKDVSKNEYAFTIASVIIFSFVPSLFHSYSLVLFNSLMEKVGNFFFFTIFIPYLLWISHPIATFLILRHKDKNFKLACAQFFTCSKNYTDQGFVDFSSNDEESRVSV